MAMSTSLYQAYQHLYQQLLDKKHSWELEGRGAEDHKEISRLAQEWILAERKLIERASNAIEFLKSELAKEKPE